VKHERLSAAALTVAVFLALCGASAATIDANGRASRSLAAVALSWGSTATTSTWGSGATTSLGSFSTSWASTSKAVWGSKKSKGSYGTFTTEWGADPEEGWGAASGRKARFSTGSYVTTWQPGAAPPWGGSASSSVLYGVPKLDASGALWGGRVTTTWSLEADADALGETPFERDLTVGSVGSDVLALQKFLNARGFQIAAEGSGSSGEESDYFGERTRAALAAFQLANGIVPAEGYCGAATRAVLATMGWGEAR